jgi:hypothetical protein
MLSDRTVGLRPRRPRRDGPAALVTIFRAEAAALLTFTALRDAAQGLIPVAGASRNGSTPTIVSSGSPSSATMSAWPRLLEGLLVALGPAEENTFG